MPENGGGGGDKPRVCVQVSPTFTVWSREAVATRDRGPPQPQWRSVMGRVCRDQTYRGAGVRAGSTCNTLWGGVPRAFSLLPTSQGTPASSMCPQHHPGSVEAPAQIPHQD